MARWGHAPIASLLCPASSSTAAGGDGRRAARLLAQPGVQQGGREDDPGGDQQDPQLAPPPGARGPPLAGRHVLQQGEHDDSPLRQVVQGCRRRPSLSSRAAAGAVVRAWPRRAAQLHAQAATGAARLALARLPAEVLLAPSLQRTLTKPPGRQAVPDGRLPARAGCPGVARSPCEAGHHTASCQVLGGSCALCTSCA